MRMKKETIEFIFRKVPVLETFLPSFKSLHSSFYRKLLTTGKSMEKSTEYAHSG